MNLLNLTFDYVFTKTDVKALFIVFGFLTIAILSTYLANRKRPDKESKEEWTGIGDGFKSNQSLSTDDDFAEYAKYCAKQSKVIKEQLLKYLIGNKYLLLSTYYKKTSRKLESTQNLTDLFSKIQLEY